MLDENADNIDQSPYNITQLGIESIKEALAPLNQVKNITLSMPLASVSDPEDGYIVDTAHLRIWRRGSGDRFHPALVPVFDVDRFCSHVHSTEDRYVRALFVY
jgi:sensor domain CHASE-containing protein